MRYLNLFLILLLLLTYNLFSQGTNIAITFDPLSNSNRDFEFELTFRLPITPSDGIAIEHPQEISLIPVEITINDSKLWLKNSDTVALQDSVVAWQVIPSGIMIIFKNGLFNVGDELRLRCISAISSQNVAQSQVRVKEIVSQADGMQVASEIFASGSVPQISNQ
jgi:hypothetical protein